MKTKIIYISGSEIFDMADIRAAFEEVRGTLGLDSDTVLFGVQWIATMLWLRPAPNQNNPPPLRLMTHQLWKRSPQKLYPNLLLI